MVKKLIIILFLFVSLVSFSQKPKKFSMPLMFTNVSEDASATKILGLNNGDTVTYTSSINIDTMTLFMGFKDSSILVNLTQNVPAKINDSVYNIVINEGYTVQADSVQLPFTGKYDIDIGASYNGNNGDKYHCNISVNGSEVPLAGETQRSMTNNSEGFSEMMYTGEFNAGDWISFTVTNVNNNNDITFKAINFRIKANLSSIVAQLNNNYDTIKVNVINGNNSDTTKFGEQVQINGGIRVSSQLYSYASADTLDYLTAYEIRYPLNGDASLTVQGVRGGENPKLVTQQDATGNRDLIIVDTSTEGKTVKAATGTNNFQKTANAVDLIQFQLSFDQDTVYYFVTPLD